MKAFKLAAGCALAAVALGLAGCGSTQHDPVNPPQPFVFPGQTPDPGMVQTAPTPGLPTAPVPITPIAVNPNQIPQPTPPPTAAILSAGDLVRISFSDLPPPGIQPLDIRIPPDGKITLPYNITVFAVGKTVNQLQEEIRNAYVPSLFVRLTVTIRPEDRFYYVGGEVRAPARQPYMGEITVLRAIDSVGGFTDFANRRKIELRRATGEIIKVDWKKASKNPRLDPPVYPNDQITVHRRW
ncbi:MAG: polysaccharide biosynthesis/export family protein [Verrucomicrobia subdivision 3 bacterium]|nr:polysaccharide biosynthesis/export family protein [Limisphaerales bacterium]